MDETEARFHDLYYNDMDRTWAATFWRGVPVFKCPLDLWIYQEILFETKPRVIIECGASHGGSALWFADMMRLITGAAHVVTIDVADARDDAAKDPDVTFLLGNDISAKVIEQVSAHGAGMVVLDSNHESAHVARQLELYAPLVAPGCYLVVEDTNVGGNPVWTGFDDGRGPMHAAREFAAAHNEFSVDRSREKFHLTFNPEGYMLRDASS
jgi:cephalosporin hydroxylase